MKTYKVLAAGLAAAGMLVAGTASAQTASTTAVGVSGPDLAVSINGSGITLDATHSSQSIVVRGLPFSIGGGVGGSCQLTNGSTNLGTVGVSNANNSVDFTNNSVTVPAGQSVTIGVSCTGATPGTYPVTLATSLIPAIVANTNQSITPRGIGGGADNDTTAVGTLTINSSGTVGGITGNTGGTGSTGGSVLGASTGVPNVPNTGAGGDATQTLALAALAAAVAAGGLFALRRMRTA